MTNSNAAPSAAFARLRRAARAGFLKARPGDDTPRLWSLLPYQREAVDFAVPRRRAYLALAPGLGKTPIAATVAARLNVPTVYFSPPFLVRNVESEFSRWAPGLRVNVYGRLTDQDLHQTDVLILPDSLLTTRDELTGDLTRFFAGRRALAIIDEAHRFKNGKAKRTGALLGGRGPVGDELPGLVDLFDRRIYMSGTPMPNRPMELYALLAKEAPEAIDWMTEFEFGRRYCGGHLRVIHIGRRQKKAWDFSGASHLPELRERVQGGGWPFMLRMHKDRLALPPLREEIFVVSADMSPRLARLDRDVSETYGRGPDLVRYALAAAQGLETAKDLHVASYRRLLGLEKVRPAAEYISALLEDSDESILVFAFHKEVVAQLEAALAAWRPITITGATSSQKRLALVDRFQSSPDHRLVLGNYAAMGVGFTLTKATRVIFVEYDWVPGVNRQAIDRAHRFGQKFPVLAQYMVYRNSLDRDVVEAVLTKSESTKHI